MNYFRAAINLRSILVITNIFLLLFVPVVMSRAYLPGANLSHSHLIVRDPLPSKQESSEDASQAVASAEDLRLLLHRLKLIESTYREKSASSRLTPKPSPSRPRLEVQEENVAQPHLLNNQAKGEVDESRVQAIIERAEMHFEQGKLKLNSNDREGARLEFDKAVDSILAAGIDVRTSPRLEKFYTAITKDIHQIEVPDRGAQRMPGTAGAIPQAGTKETPVEVGFVEQKFEPSPLDELRTLKLDEKETDVSADDVAKLESEIKNTLDFRFTPHPLVQGFINYYQGRGRGTMETGLRRSGQYMAMARKIFREEGVPEDIVWLAQVTSSWNPGAFSINKKSAGLWQLDPEAAARLGLRQNIFLDERHGFERATLASARYLKSFANRYSNNWELALAAYNTGEGDIDRAIRRAGSLDFWAIYPYLSQETRNYVPNIFAVILIAKHPEKYGFRNVTRMPPLAYDTVSLPSSTSLQLIADATDTDLDNILNINPELKGDVTPQGEIYLIRVPPRKGHQLADILRRIPVGERTTARVISIAPGDDVLAIAHRMELTIEQLQKLNSGLNLKDINSKLVVPGGVYAASTRKSVGPENVKQAQWIKVSPVGEEWAISLPSNPAKDESLLKQHPLIIQRVYTVADDGCVYIVGSHDVKLPAMKQRNLLNFLSVITKEIMQSYSAKSGGDLQFYDDRDVPIKDSWGRQFSWAEDDRFHRILLYPMGSEYYILWVNCRTQSKPSMERFMSSFSFGRAQANRQRRPKR